MNNWARIAVSVFSLLVLHSFSQEVQAAEQDLSRYFQSAARDLSISPELTTAIARVESDHSPFALNVEGQSFFFGSKEEAIFAAKEAMAAGKSFDSGVMQINSQWLTRYSIPVEALFDPEANIYVGSWILSQNLRTHGDLDTAIARYHSPKEERGKAYVELVKAALAQGPEKAKAATSSQTESLDKKKSKKKTFKEKAAQPPDISSLVVYRRPRPIFNRVQAHPDSAPDGNEQL